MALTTLNSVKNQAGISLADTTLDLQIRSFIDGITARVKRQLNRDIEQQIYNEYYSGDNSSILFLKQYPVVTINSIIVDDTAYFGQGPGSSPTTLVAGTDYALMAGYNGIGSSGAVRRINGTWRAWDHRRWGIVSRLPPLPSGNILVNYTAGYSPVPADIQMTVNLAVMKMIAMAATGSPIASNSYEDASESYFSPELAASVFGSIENNLAQTTMPVI